MNAAELRRAIYDRTIRTGRVPTAAELGVSIEELQELAGQRIIVLGDDGTIVMAAPFSGVPTPFVVRTAEASYFANCIWDALGVSPMLGVDSTIETSCPDCDAPLALEVRGETLLGDGVVHFSVPTRQWWSDIVFT